MTFSFTRTDSHCCPTAARPKRSTLRATLKTYFIVWMQRRALATLDINRLKDLGISPIDAAQEAARPFWDLPN